MLSADTAARYERLILELIESVRAHVRTPEQADYDVVVPFVTSGMLRQMKSLEIIAPHDDATAEERQLENRLVTDTLAILQGEKNTPDRPSCIESPLPKAPVSDAPETPVAVLDSAETGSQATQQQKGPSMPPTQQSFGYREVVNDLITSWLGLQRDTWTTRKQLEGHVTRRLCKRTLELGVVAPGTAPEEAKRLVTMMLVEEGLRQLKERGGIVCRTGVDGAEEFLFPSEDRCSSTENGSGTGIADEVTSADIGVDPDASPTDGSPAIENAGAMPNGLIDQEVPASIPEVDAAVQSPMPVDPASLGPVVVIDAEFQSLIPPSTPEELSQLAENLCRDGVCHDALKVWQEPNLLLDGHQRHQLCLKHGIPYRVEKIDLVDREAAREWILTNQLGQRNVSPKSAAYLRGLLYQSLKRQGRRTDLEAVTSGQSGQKLDAFDQEGTSGQSGQKLNGVDLEGGTSGHNGQKLPGSDLEGGTSGHNGQKLDAAAEVATRTGVPERTVRRDGQFAAAVDAIAANCGNEVRQDLLSGRLNLSRKRLQVITKLPPAEQEQEIRQTSEKKDSPRSKRKQSQTAPKAATVERSEDAKQVSSNSSNSAQDSGEVKTFLGRLADAEALLAECAAEVTTLDISFDDQEKAEALATVKRIIAGGQQILDVLSESEELADDDPATELVASEG